MEKNLLLAGPSGGSEITNPVLGPDLQTLTSSSQPTDFLNIFLPNAIGLLFVGGSIFFVFMMLWGAVTWIISGGDKAAIEAARGRITAALVGIVLLLSTFALIKIIETFFGIDILTIDIGPLVIQ